MKLFPLFLLFVFVSQLEKFFFVLLRIIRLVLRNVYKPLMITFSFFFCVLFFSLLFFLYLLVGIIAGFTSCHVFMVDSRLVAHEGHAARAHAFRFQCTPAADVDAAQAGGGGAGDGRCLEFPPTAEPILQVSNLFLLFFDCWINQTYVLFGWQERERGGGLHPAHFESNHMTDGGRVEIFKIDKNEHFFCWFPFENFVG